MLQQTTVAAVGPYFRRFIERWPTLVDLAAASSDDVMKMWAGLGYYRRARGLHACAQAVVQTYAGRFPQTEAELLKLPGLGPYTAAAVLAIAFDKRANVVDGNVERVVARLFSLRTPLPKVKKEIREKAETLLPTKRYGDYAQALMDLGATVCTPRSPKCALCPWRTDCTAWAEGVAETLPRREKPKAKPLRRGFAFVAQDGKGAVYLRQRPETGLLASMTEVPSTPWEEGAAPAWEGARHLAPMKARWRLLEGAVRHTFTHFDLEITVAMATIAKRIAPDRRVKGRWVSVADLDGEALPSVMRKILRHALQDKEQERA